MGVEEGAVVAVGVRVGVGTAVQLTQGVLVGWPPFRARLLIAAFIRTFAVALPAWWISKPSPLSAAWLPVLWIEVRRQNNQPAQSLSNSSSTQL
jgi:hypothetical protein